MLFLKQQKPFVTHFHSRPFHHHFLPNCHSHISYSLITSTKMPLNRLFSTASIAFAKESPSATLQLNGGLSFCGKSFGAPKQSSGEVVFTTSLVGYPESMTDPSYRGQILVFTQPLIGNYGVPSDARDAFGLLRHFESDRIQVKGIIVSDYAEKVWCFYCDAHWLMDLVFALERSRVSW